MLEKTIRTNKKHGGDLMTKFTWVIIGIMIAVAVICTMIEVSMCEGAQEMDLTRAVIHHTNSKDVPVSVIRKWHVEGNGWDDVGYHFLIRKNGRVEVGRPLNKRGAHAKGNKWHRGRNHYIGIALTGKDEFTGEQATALYRLCMEFGIEKVERHHDKCPGPGFGVEEIQEILDDVYSTELYDCADADVRAEVAGRGDA